MRLLRKRTILVADMVPNWYQFLSQPQAEWQLQTYTNHKFDW